MILAVAPLLLQPALGKVDDASPKPVVKTPDGTFTANPYLQLGQTPAPGTLELLWHTPDVEADWSVDVQASAGQPWRKCETPTARRVAMDGIQPQRVYRATISGLEAGGVFKYVVNRGKEGVFSAEARAPKSSAQPYRFVAFGDCGAGTPEQKPIAQRAFHEKPDFVMVPGDIVYERGRVSEYGKRFWEPYNSSDPREGVPMLRSTLFIGAPGNHDIDTRNLDQYPDALAYYFYWSLPLNGPFAKEGSALVPALTASDSHRRAFEEAAGSAYPRMANFSFDYGNAHWTIVDSNPYVDWTNAELKEWVARDLVAAQNTTWRFVAFHHPGFNSAREHFEQQQMRLLAPVLEAGKVDVVFNGHVHNYQRSYPMRFVPDRQSTLLVGGRDLKTPRGRVVNGQWTLDKKFDGRTDTTPEGIIYVITGAGGQHLYNPEQNNDPDSWQRFTDKFVSDKHSITVADVDGKKMTVRQVTADGMEVDKFVVTK
jgi:hypothetical protein